jgi:hypothetical protein
LGRGSGSDEKVVAEMFKEKASEGEARPGGITSRMLKTIKSLIMSILRV